MFINRTKPQSAWPTYPSTMDPDGNLEPLATPSTNWVPRPNMAGKAMTNGTFHLDFQAVPGYTYTAHMLLPLTQIEASCRDLSRQIGGKSSRWRHFWSTLERYLSQREKHNGPILHFAERIQPMERYPRHGDRDRQQQDSHTGRSNS
jgi:hypothetical protein